jgi:hypothetical protein
MIKGCRTLHVTSDHNNKKLVNLLSYAVLRGRPMNRLNDDTEILSINFRKSKAVQKSLEKRPYQKTCESKWQLWNTVKGKNNI